MRVYKFETQKMYMHSIIILQNKKRRAFSEINLFLHNGISVALYINFIAVVLY